MFMEDDAMPADAGAVEEPKATEGAEGGEESQA